MTFKIISITIPEDKIIPHIQEFSPEENYLILKIGAECLIECRKRAIALSQEEIYNKIKVESRIEIEKLEREIIVEKESSQRLEKITKEMFENQIGRLDIRIKNLISQVQSYEEQIKLYEKNNESEIKTRIEEFKEKHEAEIEKTKEKYDLLLKEKDTHNQLNRAAFDSALQLLNRQKTIVEKGKEGEDDFFELANHTFRDFQGFQIENMAKQSHKGDFHLTFDYFKVLVDMKNYTNNVGKKEIDKIEKDLLDNEDMNFAWLISLNTDISGWNRCPIMFKWIMSNIGPKCIVFINQFNKNPVNILRTLWIVSVEFYKLSKKPEESVYEDVKELKKDFEDKKFLLCKHIKSLQNSANEIRKSLNALLGVLKNINSELLDMLYIVSDEIVSNKSCTNYDVIYDWFSNNVEEVEDEKIKISCIELWNGFKRKNKEYITDKKITLEIFKQVIKNIIDSSKYVDKAKTFELIGYKLKIEEIIIENVVTTAAIAAVPKDKKIKKNEYYFDKEKDKQVLELYKIESNNIITISNEINVRPWEIVSLLVQYKIINSRKNARGYDSYKETDEYKNKVAANTVYKMFLK
jgi:hypothetical protein